MHGMGGTAESYNEIFRPNGPMHFENMRVVLPDAPMKPMSMSGGLPMKTWFDIKPSILEEKQKIDSYFKEKLDKLKTNEMLNKLYNQIS